MWLFLGLEIDETLVLGGYVLAEHGGDVGSHIHKNMQLCLSGAIWIAV